MSIQKKKERATIIIVVNWILFTISALALVAFFLSSFVAFDAVALWIKKNFTHHQQSLALFQLFALTGGERAVTDEDVANVLKAEQQLNLHEARLLLSTLQVLLCVVGTVAILVQLGANTILTLGVRRSDRSKLRIWCRIQAVFLILGVLSIFARVLNIWISFNTHPWYLLLTDLGSVLWIGYSLWTVQEFNNALKCTNVATDGRTDEENVHSRQKENKPKKYNDCLLYCCAALC